MRWISRIFVLLLTAGLLWPVVALAGGGGGGECTQNPSSMGDGWVSIAGFCFTPQTIPLTTGASVRWLNQDQVTHTVTFDSGLDSGDLAAGASWAAQFNTPGTYLYVCRYHSGMTGNIVVTGNALNGPAVQAIDPATPQKASLTGSGLETLQPAPDRTVLVSVDATTGVTLVLFGLSIGAGAAAFLWFGRRREALANAPARRRRR